MKLGMGDLVQSAFVAIRRGGRPLSLCLGLWVVTDLARRVFRPILRPLAQQVDAAFGDLTVLTQYLDAGLRVVTICVFVTFGLRLLLTGRIGPWGLTGNGLVRAIGVSLLAWVGVVIVATGIKTVNLFHEQVRYQWKLVWVDYLLEIGTPILIVTVTAYLFSRTCLVWPSASVGQGLALIRNWRRTAGNGFRLSLINTAAFFGLVVIYGLLDDFLVQSLLERYGLSMPAWMYAAIMAGQMILLMTVLMAFSAVAFTRLTGFPAAGIPGADKTPEQLAGTFD